MKRVVAIVAWLALSCAAAPATAASRTLTLGTAGAMGVYHPIGGAICRMVNVTRKAHRLRCSVEPSDGSVANIRGVLAGDLDLGIAQSDVQYYAQKGEGPFKDTPQAKLRALFSVYPELVTLVAREDANIGSVADLEGKRVGVGPAGSGTRATAQVLLAAFGLSSGDLKAAVELKFIEYPPALCGNKVDAFVLVAGHPNPAVHEAANSCATRIVPVAGPPVDALLKERPYYAKARIPARMYKGTDTAQPTFGTMASVVVSADMPDDVAYAIAKAVFDNFEDFRKLHPALASLTREEALKGNVAPLHPGAVKYFKEAGLM
ncbi:MAG: TAXI family TRAP transporter solute-binding subunit [Burkholderiales bacterium]|nr:TAXI family TRAP transporter solute-binding subunit [Burkholderiales bacterium]